MLDVGFSHSSYGEISGSASKRSISDIVGEPGAVGMYPDDEGRSGVKGTASRSTPKLVVFFRSSAAGATFWLCFFAANKA